LLAKNIILMDDGLAKGATMLAVIYAVKKQFANKVIVAVPLVTKDAFYVFELLSMTSFT